MILVCVWIFVGFAPIAQAQDSPATAAASSSEEPETLESEATEPVSETMQAIPGLPLQGVGPATMPAQVEPPRRWVTLNSRLERLTENPFLKAKEIGVYVASMPGGEPVFGYNSAQPMNPASNVKVLTSAAALTMLGPGYRFKTEIHLTEPPKNGVIEGDLYVKGYGDPTMVSERLWMLVNSLKERGIREIKGRIVVDNTFFAGAPHNPGWVREQDGSQAYQAPYGAVSLNFNAIRITVLPGDNTGDPAIVIKSPDSDYFHTESSVKTVAHGRTKLTIDTESWRGRTRIKLRGRINIRSWGRTVYRKIDHPALYFGYSLLQFLRQQGIKIPKKAVRVKKLPYNAEIYYTFYSPHLSEIIWALNKRSNNFTAEQLLKTMGAELYEPPGDWIKGLKALKYFLTYLGIQPDSYRLVNGSGLADITRISPRDIVRVLHFMYVRTELMPEFAASLAVGGVDGTLRRRMKELSTGKIRAKTGSLDMVNALSGYAIAKNREVLAFSIIVNNDLPYSEQAAIIDSIAETLATTPPDE